MRQIELYVRKIEKGKYEHIAVDSNNFIIYNTILPKRYVALLIDSNKNLVASYANMNKCGKKDDKYAFRSHIHPYLAILHCEETKDYQIPSVVNVYTLPYKFDDEDFTVVGFDVDDIIKNLDKKGHSLDTIIIDKNHPDIGLIADRMIQIGI